MNSLTIAGLAFACIFGGVLLGMLLRMKLPAHHLQDESKDVIKLGAGLMATMAALVLGLLVSSAKSSFDSLNDGFKESGARVLMLDRVLSQYGPQTREIRQQLRNNVSKLIELIWPSQPRLKANVTAIENGNELETVLIQIRSLTAENEVQRALKAQAVQICSEMMHSRWLMIEHTQNSLPAALFFVVVFWLTMLHLIFGLLTPRNGSVLVVLIISSLSVSAALFLISEMNHPVDGTIQLSKAPMQKALEHLGK